jgi:superfamily I DNA/RNA helicase
VTYAQTAARYDLPNSYRFGFNIAAPANRLIAHNVDRINIAIQAISSNAGTVEVMHDVPYAQIASTAAELLKTCSPKDIAVLARKHSTLQHCHEAMLAAGVAVYRIGGEDAIPATGAFRTVRGYLRLSVNEWDRRAFMAITAAEHLSEADILEIRVRALKDGCSLTKALQAVKGSQLPATIQDVAQRLKEGDPWHEYGPAVDYIREIMFREALTTTREVVDAMAMASVQDQLAHRPVDAVTLCTIHAAKGLEWPTVFLIGMDSKSFPSTKSVLEGRLEEERRLAYVGMTRAEQRLYMVHNIPHAEDGVVWHGPSMFLNEVEAE